MLSLRSRRLVPLALLAVLLLVAAACGSSSNGGTTAAGTSGSSTTASTTNGAAPSSTPTPDTGGSSGSGSAGSGAAAAAVKVKTIKGYGKILVSADGRTLYDYTPDQGAHSACTAGCLQAWPPATAPKATAGPGVNPSMLKVVHGAVANQLMYNDHLLYYYVADKKPGSMIGASIPQWYPIDPTGKEVHTKS